MYPKMKVAVKVIFSVISILDACILLAQPIRATKLVLQQKYSQNKEDFQVLTCYLEAID